LPLEVGVDLLPKPPATEPKKKSRSSSPNQSDAISAEALFRGQREVYIEFGGAHYRLRITRKNKLILCK
jgi:hemin uptake protein HemP